MYFFSSVGITHALSACSFEKEQNNKSFFVAICTLFFAVKRLSDASRPGQTIRVLLAFVHKELLLKKRNKPDSFFNFILRSIFDITIFEHKIKLEKIGIQRLMLHKSSECREFLQRRKENTFVVKIRHTMWTLATDVFECDNNFWVFFKLKLTIFMQKNLKNR